MSTNSEIHDAGQSSNKRDISAVRTQPYETSRFPELASLPGLPNQSLFNDRVGQAILLARRHRSQAAVLMLRLDGMIGIIDSLGQSAGDDLLHRASRCIIGCLRTHDTITWLGGDKFLVLMQDIQQPEDVATAASRVQKALALNFSDNCLELVVPASIGACIYPDDALNTGALIKRAETAMLLARRNGRQQCHFYRTDIDARAVSPESIEQGLPLALERNELTLHYQAKFDLKTGDVSGVEALTRWTHPKYGSILPGQFLPIAEKSYLILPIGAWVLREACTQSRAWAKTGTPAKAIAVNISATEFQGKHFLDSLAAILTETDVAPEALELDISLDVLMTHPGRSAFILKTLRDRGIHVSVDNFGARDFNLASLQELPLAAMKIDRQVVSRITTSPAGATTVDDIIQLGRRLNLRVIAEGVERAGDMEFLWAHNCDEAQGNFLSRTMPAEQLAGLLGSRRSISRRDRMPKVFQQFVAASHPSDEPLASPLHLPGIGPAT